LVTLATLFFPGDESARAHPCPPPKRWRHRRQLQRPNSDVTILLDDVTSLCRRRRLDTILSHILTRSVFLTPSLTLRNGFCLFLEKLSRCLTLLFAFSQTLSSFLFLSNSFFLSLTNSLFLSQSHKLSLPFSVSQTLSSFLSLTNSLFLSQSHKISFCNFLSNNLFLFLLYKSRF
jgi:hypothetical protein